VQVCRRDAGIVVDRIRIERRARVVDERVHVLDVLDGPRVHHHHFVLDEWHAENVERAEKFIRVLLRNLGADWSVLLAVDGVEGVDVVDVGVGRERRERGVHIVGDEEVVESTDADVGVNHILPVETRLRDAESLRSFLAEEHAAGAGVEEGRDVEGGLSAAEVRFERIAVGGRSKQRVDLRLIERCRQNAVDRRAGDREIEMPAVFERLEAEESGLLRRWFHVLSRAIVPDFDLSSKRIWPGRWRIVSLYFSADCGKIGDKFWPGRE